MFATKANQDIIGETITVGIAIDNNLKFDEHLTNIYLKANKKLTAVIRTRKYLDVSKM